MEGESIMIDYPLPNGSVQAHAPVEAGSNTGYLAGSYCALSTGQDLALRPDQPIEELLP